MMTLRLLDTFPTGKFGQKRDWQQQMPEKDVIGSRSNPENILGIPSVSHFDILRGHPKRYPQQIFINLRKKHFNNGARNGGLLLSYLTCFVPVMVLIFTVAVWLLGMTVMPSNISGKRLLWDGPLFGRLTKAGRCYLERQGWERLPSASVSSQLEEELLTFIWPNKSGPQFNVDTVEPAFVRPYSTSITKCVDDKLCLQETLKGFDIMPEYIKNLKDAEQDTLYFVKHRYGAQGKSVYVHDFSSLKAWFESCKNTNDFVIQRQVIPALDEMNRKFVLRAHVLVYKRGGDSTLVAGLHKDVICLAHALPYEPSTAVPKSVHVSQAGKKHPTPSLVSELSTLHPAANVFPSMQSCSTTLIKATMDAFNPPYIANQVTCFALIGADYLVSSQGEVKLCEVNSHPALGWGSMAAVPREVFVRLVTETLSVVVMHEPLASTGFVPLSLED